MSSANSQRRAKRTTVPSAASKRREKNTLLHSRPLSSSSDEEEYFEASLHQLPRTLTSEIKLVFPDLASRAQPNNNGDTARKLLAIPTYHTASFSILEINDKTEAERLRLFLRFKTYAQTLSQHLKQIDPLSSLDIPDIDGAATFGRATITIYDEVSSTRALLGYSTFLYMGVQIVHHPVIGYARLAVHTVLMYARPEDAKEAFGRMEQVESLGESSTTACRKDESATL